MSSFTPGQVSPRVDPLALDEPKDIGGIISSAWSIWTSRPKVFLLIAVLIVVPLEVIFVGVIGHGFGRNFGEADRWTGAIWGLLSGTVVSALITATHARAVVSLADGQELTTRRALRQGFDRYGLVLAAALLYGLAAIISVLGIIIGMFFTLVAGVFTAQIAALEGLGPIASLKASFRLVMHIGWWRTCGYMLVIGILTSVIAGVLGVGLGIAAAVSDSAGGGAVLIVVQALLNAAVYSFTALATTLLYFSWKARVDSPPVVGSATPPADGPFFVKP